MKVLLALFLVGSGYASEPLWEFDAGEKIIGAPVVHGDHIYVSGGQSLFALDKQGRKLWQYPAGAAIAAAVAVSGENIFLHAENGLHAVSLQGKKQWFFAAPDRPLAIDGKSWGWGEGVFTDPWAWYRSDPIVAGDSVFVGSGSGVYAVSKETGQQQWFRETGLTHTTPAIHEGILVVGSWDNHVYGLKTDTGEIAWKLEGSLPQGAMAGWNG